MVVETRGLRGLPRWLCGKLEVNWWQNKNKIEDLDRNKKEHPEKNLLDDIYIFLELFKDKAVLFLVWVTRVFLNPVMKKVAQGPKR